MARLGFWSQAADESRRTAVIEEGRTLSAGHVLAMANRLAHGLRAHGAAAGDVLAVAMANRAELLMLALATAQIGGYFLPLNPGAPPSELEASLREGQARWLVHDASCQELSGARADLNAENVFGLETGTDSRSWNTLWEGHSEQPPEQRFAGATLAVTSGSTGQPKVWRRPLSGLSPEHLGKQAALHLRAVCGIEPESGLVHLVASPLHHSASLLWCLDQLHLGHSVVLMPVERWDPERALQEIERHRVTSTLMVPTHFRRLRDLPEKARRRDLSSLRHLVHTGAPCPVPLKRAMLEWLGQVVYEVYGAAEGPGTRVGPQEWLERPGTVGQSHGRVRVVDENGQELGANAVGEVCLRIPAPPAEDQKESPFPPGFRSVGDLGYLDKEGYLYLVGRRDDVIITGGVNVHPREVEEVLVAHPEIADIAVLGVPDPQWGQRLMALVLPQRPAEPSLLDRLPDFCRAHLSGPKRPREFRLVESLPRDPHGKLRRRHLQAMLESPPEVT